MPRLNKSREMPEEKREEKHLNVRSVDVRVSKNADLAVAEVREIRVGRFLMRVHTDRGRDVMNHLA